MSYIFGLCVGFLIILKWIVSGVPISEIYTKYEEYDVEHEISTTQAKNTALHMDIDALVTPVGCQKCTTSEINYCLGRDLINDHCCCDKRYKETLPYVPHTCYLGPQLCKPIVSDCETYYRLKACCCAKYVLKHWKAKANASNLIPSTSICLIGAILITIFATL